MKKLFGIKGRVVALVTGLASLGLASLVLASLVLASCDVVLSGSDNVMPLYGIRLRSDTDGVFPTALAGYTTPPVISITVVNEGNRDTGPLAITLEGDTDDFNLETASISNITAGGSSEFTVSPKTDREAGKTYIAEVKAAPAAGNRVNIKPASFPLSFTVKAIIRDRIDLLVDGVSSGHIDFGTADTANYTAPDAKTVVIVNTWNAPIPMLTITNSNADAFSVSPDMATNIQTGSAASFTVQPKTGLAAGEHSATVTVKDTDDVIRASLTVDFTVRPTVEISFSVGGTDDVSSYTFTDADEGKAVITVNNESDYTLGPLNITLSDSSSKAFTLSETTIASIAAGGSAAFTVSLTEAALPGWNEGTITVESDSNVIVNKTELKVRVQVLPTAPLGSVAAAVAYLQSYEGDKISGTEDALPLPMKADLSDGGLATLSEAIVSAGKYVALDLSASTGTLEDGIFYAEDISSEFIVDFVYPDEAEEEGTRDPVESRASVLKAAIGTGASSSLTSVSGANLLSISENRYWNSTALVRASFPKATTIGQGAFANCLNLSSVDISGAATIEAGAFYGCSALKSVSFPIAATIENNAFENCSNLISVDIRGATSLGDKVFGNASATTLVITLGDKPPTIGESDESLVFYGADNGKTVNLLIPEAATGYDAEWISKFKATGGGTVNLTINESELTYGISLSADGLETDGTIDFGSKEEDGELPQARTVTIINPPGNQATGELTLTLTGDSAFTLDPPAKIASIAVNGTAEFTVVPNTLTAGEYSATVKVSGRNGIEESFGVSFTVTKAAIKLQVDNGYMTNNTVVDFGKVNTGYNAPAAKPVVIVNTSDAPISLLTITLEDEEDAFSVSENTVSNIQPGSAASFTVQPKTGFTEAKTYTATVKVSDGSGIEKSFGVKFTVNLSPSFTVTFDLNYEGAGSTPQTVNHGSKATKPDPDPDPVREWALFTGWFKDEEGETAWDFDTDTVMRDMTLFAKWDMTIADAADSVKNAAGGTTINDPVKLVMEDMNLAAWSTFMNAMNGTGKYFDLDLSECSVEGMTDIKGEFDAAKNMGKMTGIVLPNDATSIKALSFQGVYKAPHYLLKASGANVELIGVEAFDRCTSLAEADFPKAITIEAGAFWECYPLKEADFPLVTFIGNNGFNSTGLVTANFPELRETGYLVFASIPALKELYVPNLEKAGPELFWDSGTTTLIITMGANPPDFGYQTFARRSYAQPHPLKTVVIKVPAAAVGNYTAEWVDKFKWKGWGSVSYFEGDEPYDFWNIAGNVTVMIAPY